MTKRNSSNKTRHESDDARTTRTKKKRSGGWWRPARLCCVWMNFFFLFQEYLYCPYVVYGSEYSAGVFRFTFISILFYGSLNISSTYVALHQSIYFYFYSKEPPLYCRYISYSISTQNRLYLKPVHKKIKTVCKLNYIEQKVP